MVNLDIVYDLPLKNCKDCLEEFGYCQRPSPYAGPRCRTHALAKRNSDRRRRHRSAVEEKYNLEAGGYDELYEYQGGCCAICRRARGVKRNLAIDHAHSCCNRNGSCGECVRGLLCMRCNSLLAHIRDDVSTAKRIYEYLDSPPFQQLRADRSAEDLQTVMGPSGYLLDDDEPYTGTDPWDQG
jgi:hypothetical protein